MANMTAVIKVNGVVCEQIRSNQIKMYGRKKMLYTRKMVENHVLTGKWTSVKVAQMVVLTPTAKKGKFALAPVLEFVAGVALILLCSIVA